jgi:hypothetical protein
MAEKLGFAGRGAALCGQEREEIRRLRRENTRVA